MITKYLCITFIITATSLVEAIPIDPALRIKRSANYDLGYPSVYNPISQIQYDLDGNPIIANDNNGGGGNEGGYGDGNAGGNGDGNYEGENDDGYGNGPGNIDGYKNGPEHGDGDGYGSEHGDGDGYGNGPGDGDGYGNGPGNVDEDGYGNGSGNVDGDGDGSGNGDENGGKHEDGGEASPPITEKPQGFMGGLFHKFGEKVKNAVDEGSKKVHSAIDSAKSKFGIDKFLGK